MVRAKDEWEIVKYRLKLLEKRFGVKKGGRLFWLYVFNCLASLALVVVFAGLVHWILFIFAVIGVTSFIVFVDVTKFWNKVTKERG